MEFLDLQRKILEQTYKDSPDNQGIDPKSFSKKIQEWAASQPKNLIQIKSLADKAKHIAERRIARWLEENENA